MNRSAKDGEWSIPHYGGEGNWVPLRRTKVCAGDTAGKSVRNSGRPGIVQRAGTAGIMRHSPTKGRETGNAKPGLESPEGRCEYKRKRNSGRCGGEMADSEGLIGLQVLDACSTAMAAEPPQLTPIVGALGRVAHA